MSDHLSEKQIASYWERTSSMPEVERIEDHIAICLACRERLAGVEDFHAALSQPQTPSKHATYEQLEAYVERTISPAEGQFVRVHAARCERCAAELRDLQTFAMELATSKSETPVRRHTLLASLRWSMAGTRSEERRVGKE